MNEQTITQERLIPQVTTPLLTAAELTKALLTQIEQLAPGWLAERPELDTRLLDLIADDPNQLLRIMPQDEFLMWYQDINLHAEWVEGKVYIMTAPSPRHQLVSMFLSTLLNLYINTRELGALFAAPTQMRFTNPHSIREPDLLFIAQEHLTRIKGTYIEGPADLIIEIVSPESIGRDRGDKYYQYADAGVSEYWVIDPQREWADFYLLGERGSYEVTWQGRTGEYTSTILQGLTFQVEWLWQDSPPLKFKYLVE